MRRLGTAITLLCVAFGSAAAQSVNDYLKLRNARHIVQPISSQNLDQFVGSKVVELQGVVQGSFKNSGAISLMLQRSDGEPIILDCSTPPPDWVLNGEVAVRALAQVSRSDSKGQLKADMVAVATEASIRKIDDIYWSAEAAKHPPKRKSTVLASRGAGSMRGWIGRSRPDWQVSNSHAERIYANFIRKRNPRLTLDEALQMAVFMVESDFDPTSTNSKSGAMGLGQLMPGTAQWMGVKNPYDSLDNVYGAIKLLRTHIDQYLVQTGSEGPALQLALAAYNAGEGAVKKYGGVPPYRETQAYVVRVLSIFHQMGGPSADPILRYR
jgi:hypothetical protein